MGVKGLFGFLERSQYRGKQVNLCNEASNGNQKERKGIVFDGNGIMHYLLNSSTKLNLGLQVSFIHGFQNFHFYHLALKFFRNFLSQGIRIYVIFDGPRPVFKTQSLKVNEKAISGLLSEDHTEFLSEPTYIEAKNLSYLFPVSASHVFELMYEALSTLEGEFQGDVNWKVAYGEADPEVVRVCIEENYYVIIGRDTDFIVALAEAPGAVYAPLDSLNFKNEREILTSVYDPQVISNEYLNLPDSKLFPVFATLAGNDYLDPRKDLNSFHDRLYIQNRRDIIPAVTSFLRTSQNIQHLREDVFADIENEDRREHLEILYEKSLNSYCFENQDNRHETLLANLHLQNEFQKGRLPIDVSQVLLTRLIEGAGLPNIERGICSKKVRSCYAQMINRLHILSFYLNPENRGIDVLNFPTIPSNFQELFPNANQSMSTKELLLIFIFPDNINGFSRDDFLHYTRDFSVTQTILILALILTIYHGCPKTWFYRTGGMNLIHDPHALCLRFVRSFLMASALKRRFGNGKR